MFDGGTRRVAVSIYNSPLAPGKGEGSHNARSPLVKEAIALLQDLIIRLLSPLLPMPGCSRPLLLLCAAALVPALMVPLAAKPPRAAAVPSPPLPEPDERAGGSAPFHLIPAKNEGGEAPLPRIEDEAPAPVNPEEAYDPATDPIRSSPVESVPDMSNLEQLQEIDAPGAPSDGEPMPEIPHVPGLVIPKFRTSAQVPGSQQVPGILPNANPASVPDAGTPALLPSGSIQLAAKARWIRSPYQAFKAAGEEQKPLLIFFAQLLNGAGTTASLNDDLFTLPEFNEFAAARLVLTKLQYPTGSPGKSYTEEKLAVLKLVQEKFKIRGFPAVIMLDDKGHEIERFSGYSRVKINEVTYSNAHTMLERIKEAEKRFSERKRYRQDRVNRLVAQGYRMWYSTVGTSLLAKMARADADQVILMDENGAWRAVRPVDLKLFDAEWARRKQAGLIPDEDSAETAAAASPPKP